MKYNAMKRQFKGEALLKILFINCIVSVAKHSGKSNALINNENQEERT